MAKENKKKSGIPRLLELAGEKKDFNGVGVHSLNRKCVLSVSPVPGRI